MTSSTPLHEYLRERAAAWTEVVPGTATPLRFTDVATEHAATRHTAGLFDFSFMACIEAEGRDAAIYVERVQTRAVRQMTPGQVAYTLLCREDGSVLNDATVWCRGPRRYTLFTGRRSDVRHLLAAAAGLDVHVSDVSRERATCSVQGPMALRVLSEALPGPPWDSLGYFRFHTLEYDGAICDIARLGYTGEAGFEAVVDAGAAPRLWQRFASAGARLGLAECGFEAADVLRVEAGFILFARELAHPVTPYELRLERLVRAPCQDFIGAEALRSARWHEPVRCLAGLHIDERPGGRPSHAPFAPEAVRRQGHAVATSIVRSPLHRRAIGLGFVAWDDRHAGSAVQLQTGQLARVTRLPFYDSMKIRPRRDWIAAAAQRRTGT